jgi:hypothetical protein
MELVRKLGKGKVDLTIGSALGEICNMYIISSHTRNEYNATIRQYCIAHTVLRTSKVSILSEL